MHCSGGLWALTSGRTAARRSDPSDRREETTFRARRISSAKDWNAVSKGSLQLYVTVLEVLMTDHRSTYRRNIDAQLSSARNAPSSGGAAVEDVLLTAASGESPKSRPMQEKDLVHVDRFEGPMASALLPLLLGVLGCDPTIANSPRLPNPLPSYPYRPSFGSTRPQNEYRHGDSNEGAPCSRAEP